MNIDDYSDTVSWLKNNQSREAKCHREWLPEVDELKRAIDMGGIKLEKVKQQAGKYNIDHFVLRKSPTFHYDDDTWTYIY